MAFKTSYTKFGHTFHEAYAKLMSYQEDSLGVHADFHIFANQEARNKEELPFEIISIWLKDEKLPEENQTEFVYQKARERFFSANSDDV